MKNPYRILGIDENADDNAVKQAYLQQVKLNPPDRDRERFQQIYQAYEVLKDKQSRVKYALFEVPDADFDSLLEHAFTDTQAYSINADVFGKLLSVGVGESAFKPVIAALSARQISVS